MKGFKMDCLSVIVAAALLPAVSVLAFAVVETFRPGYIRVRRDRR